MPPDDPTSGEGQPLTQVSRTGPIEDVRLDASLMGGAGIEPATSTV